MNPAYFPPLSEFWEWKGNGTPFDGHLRFQKQTWLSRCRIVGANGPLLLSIPLMAGKTTQIFKDVRISYHENWPRQHFRTLKSCLGSAPYWLYLEDDLLVLYQQPEKFLIDFNAKAMELVKQWVTVEKLNSYPQIFQDRFGFISGLSCLDFMANCGK